MAELNIHCPVSGEETEGRVAVFEEIVPAGVGLPRHIHRSQMEIFHIIEGTITFEVDGSVSQLEKGETAVVPAGSMPAFRNSGSECGGIRFELPPAGKSEESFEKLVAGDVGEDIAEFVDRCETDLAGPPLTG